MRSAHRLQAVLRALIFYVWFILDLNECANLCPPDASILPCKCTERSEEIQIWCSYSDASKLSESLKSIGHYVKKEIDELIIENNLLPSLPGQILSPVKVQRLMLRNNGLREISSNWVSGLETSIQEIYIVEPELSNFPDDSLITLPKLEALTLSAGSITRMPAIFGLSRLRYIQIEAPSIEYIPINNFQGLPFLEQLHITSIPKFSRLEADFLHDLPKLSILNFTQCGLSYIHPKALARLPMLTEVSFTGNKLKNAGIVGMAIRDFPNLSIVRLDENLIEIVEEASFVDMQLRNLYLNNNRISNIYRAAFHRLPNLRCLDLGSNRIRTIHPESFLPAGQSNVEELRLNNNEIDHSLMIRLLLDTLPKLRLLDMSKNFIQDITFGTLQGHMHLEILHLEHNRIQRIDREAFTSLPSLRELKLSNNSISNYFRAPLWNLPALKGLDLSQNKFDHLDRTLTSGLPSLRRFDISYNSIRMVDPSTFLVTPNLEHVNLSHNSIDIMNPITFSHLQKLFDIDLSYNNFTQLIPGLPTSVEYLYMANNQIPMLSYAPMSDLQLPALKLLDISNNKLHHIPGGSLNSLSTLRALQLKGNCLQRIDKTTMDGLNQLRNLNLANNKLIIINNEAFRNLKHLTELNLGGNRLEMIESSLLSQNTELKKLDISQNRLSDSLQADFRANKKIEELIMSQNSLMEFPMFVSTMSSIRILDLSQNQMKTLPVNVLSLMPMLKELKLSKNKLKQLSEGAFEKLPNLSILDLEDNDIERLSSHSVKTLPALVTIKLARNKLSTIPSSAFTNLPALQNIELQENQLTHIASDAFVACHNLLMLNLSSNLLTDMDKCGLTRLKTLEALDLSHNRIAKFSTNSMHSMNFLIMLKMDNNRLCDIDDASFENMPRLRMISLKDNKMTSLSENTFRKLSSNVISLDIEGNPIRCSCNMLWMQSWLQRMDNSYPGPRCSDGMLLRDLRFSKTNCDESLVDTVPGCEMKSNKGAVPVNPSIGTKSPYTVATFRPNSTTKFNTSSTSKSTLPLPEETDYFDPKYVEYQENNTKIDKNSIPADILSHYIPGDTPTIYAGARQRNNTREPEAVNVTPSNAGLTFFGVPISSLNLGDFWNSGKSVDKGRHELNHPVMPSPPIIDKDGFIPILPGIGGFNPILNITTTSSTTQPTIIPNRTILNKSGTIPGHATISKVALSVPKNERINVDEVLNNVSATYNTSSLKNRNSLFESSTTSTPPPPPPPGPFVRSSKTYFINNPKSFNSSVYPHKLLETNNNKSKPFPEDGNGISKFDLRKGFDRATTTSRNLYSFGHKEADNENAHSQITGQIIKSNLSSNNFSPTLLSDYLINQSSSTELPGRSSISKVQLNSGPSPHTEDVQSSHLRLAKSSFQSSSTPQPIIIVTSAELENTGNLTTQIPISENVWFFDDQSHLKPFTENTVTQNSSHRKMFLSLPILTLTTVISFFV